jgi:hypothetical protein
MGGGVPFRITVGDETQALALADDLATRARVSVRSKGHGWEISIKGSKANGLVTTALDAVRRSLDGRPSASAEIMLDGRTYRMHGE